MRKIYLLLVCGLILSANNIQAQCNGNILPWRYLNEIFPVKMTDGVVYSSVYNLKMDVYEPDNDTATLRPLIILGHGGSFVGGNRKNDATVDSLCVRYAKRGYVTVSIDYRLGASLLKMFNKDTAADIVCKAISDGKACIRYLVQNRTTYKIDTNQIFIGGNSAGAVLFMHVAYIEDITDCSPLILTALNNNGGLEGNSGNPGYTTKCKGVINLAGALNTVGVIHNNAAPSVNLQGDSDGTVPFTCALPLGGLCPDTLCGLGSLEPVYINKSVFYMKRVFVAQDHCPWMGTSTDNLAMMQTLDSLVKVFMYTLICPDIASVNTVQTSANIEMFPNPASEALNLKSTEMISGVTVLDQTGRVVLDVNGINKENCEINTSRLSKGMYIVRVRFVNENNVPVIRKVVIQ